MGIIYRALGIGLMLTIACTAQPPQPTCIRYEGFEELSQGWKVADLRIPTQGKITAVKKTDAQYSIKDTDGRREYKGLLQYTIQPDKAFSPLPRQPAYAEYKDEAGRIKEGYWTSVRNGSITMQNPETLPDSFEGFPELNDGWRAAGFSLPTTGSVRKIEKLSDDEHKQLFGTAYNRIFLSDTLVRYEGFFRYTIRSNERFWYEGMKLPTETAGFWSSVREGSVTLEAGFCAQ